MAAADRHAIEQGTPEEVLVERAGRAVDGTAVRADETICFAAYKPGLLFEPGRTHAGRVDVVDIGIDVMVTRPRLVVFDVSDLVLPEPRAEAHKWSSGCLVVGGS